MGFIETHEQYAKFPLQSPNLNLQYTGALDMSHPPPLAPPIINLPRGYRLTTPPPANIVVQVYTQQFPAAVPQYAPLESFPSPIETSLIKRTRYSYLSLSLYMSDSSPGCNRLAKN